MTIQQITELFTAGYALASVLGHVLPQSWAFTKLCLRLAANLKPATEEKKP